MVVNGIKPLRSAEISDFPADAPPEIFAFLA